MKPGREGSLFITVHWRKKQGWVGVPEVVQRNAAANWFKTVKVLSLIASITIPTSVSPVLSAIPPTATIALAVSS